MLVRAEQIRAVYKQIPKIWTATVIGGPLFAIGMSPVVPAATLTIWVAILYAVMSCTLLLYFRYVREAPPPERADKWGTAIVIACFMNGCAWGSAGAVMFQPSFTGHQLLLELDLFLVAMIAVAGGITAYLPMVYAMVLPTITPLLILRVVQGDAPHAMVIGGSILFIGIIFYYAAHLNRLLVDSFKLRFENQLARDRADDANRAKSRFLAAASHDLRQPLQTLSLYSAALKLRTADGPSGEIAGHINKALTSLSALVDSLLDISKLDAGAIKPEPHYVSVSELIERIESDYRPVAREKELQFHVAAADVFVHTDPVLFERLMRNLVDNAFKYTVAGSITLAAETDQSTVRIAVRDTGPGIPAGERERIFEEFYQVGNPERDRAQGLGLGLAIVRRLVHLLKLDLTLESEPERGSTFAVAIARVLKSDTPSREPAPAVIAEKERALDGTRVLVIDDEPEVRAGMRTLLEYLGCRVAACGGLVEVERLIDEHALEVDLVIADFRLRQHENGIDTVRRLRARLGNVPALLVTGDTAPERLREAHSSGLPLLQKPVSADKLMETMLAALRR